MSELVDEEGLGQRVGRRLGLRPYYRIVERDEGRLVLESLAERNRGPGYRIAAVGAALLLVALMILGSGILASLQGGGFGVAGISAAIAGLLGYWGAQRLIGGYAVLTTINRIIVDAEAAEVTFTQASRVGRQRRQSLAFAQLAGVRLRRRPLLVGALLRQVRPIVAIELIAGSQIWVVDSAESDAELQEVAAAIQRMIADSR